MPMRREREEPAGEVEGRRERVEGSRLVGSFGSYWLRVSIVVR